MAKVQNNNESTPPNVGGSHNAHPHHAQDYRINHKATTAIAAAIVAILAFLATVAAAMWFNINGAVVENKVEFIHHGDDEIIDPNAGKPITFLLIGQDTRDGADNAALSGGTAEDAGLHSADTTMVVEISADRKFVNLVSIPRDSLVDVPACTTSKETIPAQYGVMFNSIFANAYRAGDNLSSAASCTVEAVNSLTGLDIKHFVVVDFTGVYKMIDAVGGVDICIPMDLKDSYTDLDLKKGMQHLDGKLATSYARMRHGTGTDGSDVMRTTRQQYLIKSLMNEALSKNLFTHSSQLYKLALAALRSLNISSNMADTAALAGLAMSMKNISTDHIYAQTVPVVQAPQDPNRVIWTEDAHNVWERIKKDQPLFGEVEENTNEEKPTQEPSDSPSESPSESPTEEPTEEPQGNENGGAEQPKESKPAETVDPETGLIKKEDGTLIDPNTGGEVEPETGAIKDPKTNQYIGIADKYLNSVCAVPSEDK